MIRKLLSAITITLVIAALALAAGPNFSGTWVRDNDKSDQMGGRGGGGAGRGPGGGGPGGGGGGGPRGPMQSTLVVKQTDNDLLVTRKTKFGDQERPPVEQKFTLDGKEVSNPSGFGGRRGGDQGGPPPQMKSKAKVNKDKIVIESIQNLSTPNGDFEIATKDEWSLSADGKVLTITSTRSTPAGDNTSKQVYNKQ